MKDLFLIVMFVSIGVLIGVGVMVYTIDSQECPVKVAIPHIEEKDCREEFIDNIDELCDFEDPDCDYPILYDNGCPSPAVCEECDNPLDTLTKTNLYDICMKTGLLCNYL